MSEECDRGLRVVASKRRLAISADIFRSKDSQASLFNDAWLIVFVNVSELREDDFSNAIRYSDPSVVLDLRLAPRFDIGSLNRERAFELFRKVGATYVDATASLMNGESREGAIQRIIRHVPKDGISARKAVVFLLGRNDQSSIASSSEILSLLSQSDRQLDVITIPQFPSDSDSLSTPESIHKLRRMG